MPSLKLQKRLAASALKCGKRKVWMDPNESAELARANSRRAVRNLIKDGYILKKPNTIHSRARIRKYQEAKKKGRHSGTGRRHGTRNARTPRKGIWMQRIRVLRRLLKKYRNSGKIDRHLYRELYLKCKGFVFKNKRQLVEHIHERKAEVLRAKAADEQGAVRRARNLELRQRKAVTKANRIMGLTGEVLAKKGEGEKAKKAGGAKKGQSAKKDTAAKKGGKAKATGKK